MHLIYSHNHLLASTNKCDLLDVAFIGLGKDKMRFCLYAYQYYTNTPYLIMHCDTLYALVMDVILDNANYREVRDTFYSVRKFIFTAWNELTVCDMLSVCKTYVV